MNHAEALQKAKSRDRRVKIQAGGESSAKREAESFDRIHDRSLTPRAGSGQAGACTRAQRKNRRRGLAERASGAEVFFQAGPALAGGFFRGACAAPVCLQADGEMVTVAFERGEFPSPVDD